MAAPERRAPEISGVTPEPDLSPQFLSDRAAALLARMDLERQPTPDGAISLIRAFMPGSAEVVATARSLPTAELESLVASSGSMPMGLPLLREQVASYLSRSGLETAPEQILITNGARQAIHLVASTFLNPDDVVLVEDPCASCILQCLRPIGAQLIGVPVDRDGAIVDNLADLVLQVQPRLLCLVPTFQNPTGTAMSLARRQAVARIATELRLTVLEDNALEHSALNEGPLPPSIAACAAPDAPILTVGSLRKLLWDGLHVGWIRGTESTVQVLTGVLSAMDIQCSLLDQLVATQLLPSLEAIRASRRLELTQYFDTAYELLEKYLPSWRVDRPAGGLSLWVEIPAGTTTDLASVAIDHGIRILPGAMMSTLGKPSRRLRLPVTRDQQIMREAMRRLARAWEAYAVAA